MKTVRAGEVAEPAYMGRVNEIEREVEQPFIVIGKLHFSKSVFGTEDSVSTWLIERGLNGYQINGSDGMVFSVSLEDMMKDTVRVLWIGPGIAGEAGIVERDTTGAGVASLASAPVGMVSLNSGGSLHPQQGPVSVTASSAMSPIQGSTDANDGHQHEVYLIPKMAPTGLIIDGFTSYNEGHAHRIEASVNPKNAINAYTAPDQSLVGGHAHRHRFVQGE